MSSVNIHLESVPHSVDCVFSLFRKHGDTEYIGEAVSSQEHAVQCAMLAAKEGYSDEVVVGALLHDIGHLWGIDQGLERMVTDGVLLGAANHDIVGEEFLKELGFPESVTSIVRGHVSAKRYLVYKYKEYYESLTEASKQTLVHQGGPMTQEEAEELERNPQFKAIIRMRHWDECAKDPSIQMEPLQKYEDLCRKVLQEKFKV
ncbi:2-amino-1-hydroxyethylphosphonate dioxygenase (glycine-forming)-like [Glandiceps talaboti]